MDQIQDKNKKLAFSILGIVVFMIGLSFAAVPLYDLFCRVTGYGGTTQVSVQAPDQVFDRKITVSFDSQVDRALPWEFKPEMRHVDVQVGQQGLINYQARNITARSTVGTALYNVTPDKVGKYFHKTQCFCFAEQVIKAGETAHFPVLFYVDPEIMKDPEMDDVTDITLSYTFFPAESEALDKALSAYTVQKPLQ